SVVPRGREATRDAEASPRGPGSVAPMGAAREPARMTSGCEVACPPARPSLPGVEGCEGAAARRPSIRPTCVQVPNRGWASRRPSMSLALPAALQAQAVRAPVADWMVWALVLAAAVLVLLILSRRQDHPHRNG